MASSQDPGTFWLQGGAGTRVLHRRSRSATQRPLQCEMLQTQAWGACLRVSGFDTSGLCSHWPHCPSFSCWRRLTCREPSCRALEAYFGWETCGFPRGVVLPPVRAQWFSKPTGSPISARPRGWAVLPPLEGSASPHHKHLTATLRNALKKVFL